ncbi:MAG TPA: SpoIIE family protein phosphatase [Candidatus Sulfotelmatobacter sp.]|jgi:sigma-B regulation protein RsbU (phosphoserine phosphatase)|nr:SpoIIE family protein phosphatase [Candidatus Sulfotelmatobacter sp.]
MREFYWKLRARMTEAGLWPKGWIARGACYSLGLAVGLFVLEMLLKLISTAASESLSGWVKFLVFDAALLFSILIFRTLKRRILWRLRNRLIVTYVFIGVIPAVLLVAMAAITIYLFAGQFASFVVTSEINSQLRSMQAVNAAVSNELAARIEKGQSPTAESLAGLRKRDRAWERRRVCAWHGTRVLLLSGGSPNLPPLVFPDFFNKDQGEYAKAIREGLPFKQIVRDNDQLYLRVASVFQVGSETLTVVTGEPLDKDLVADIAANLGEITVYSAGIVLDESHPNYQNPNAPNQHSFETRLFDEREKAKDGSAVPESKAAPTANGEVFHPTFTVGSLADPADMMDREITFGTPLPVVDWKTGDLARAGALVRVRTRPSVLYTHLFAALGDIARGVEYILLAIFIFFAVIELVALIIGTRMTTTVTGAVAQLYNATRNVDRGDFSHRIPVKSSDQLAQLSLSFNSMTESIEKLILEQKEKQRLESELAIAQEVQAQLFPRQVSELESLEVHGFCRPARTVSGDYYDFLTASSHKLILAVGDISGKGISAALLMATIHSAVRAYSVESLPQMREPVAVGAVAGAGRIMAAWPEGIEVSPGALLGLLNHQLYESTPPEKYATLFLGIYDGRTHQLTYSNGGHLPPILIGENGAVRRLEAGGTVVGLFDNMTYDEGSVQMHPGEIFLAYSDGVTEPENEFGEFGEERLIDLVSANRHLPLIQISQAVTSAVDDWIGDNEQPDDITLVLARAR